MISDPVAKTKTFETARLGEAIDNYERTPSEQNKAAVSTAFAELDGEIAELETLVAKREGTDRAEPAAKLKDLQAYRTKESARFVVAQGKAAVTSPEVKNAADTVEDAAKRVGNSIENAARKTGEAIKDTVQ